MARRGGFTLVETLVTLAVTGILLAFLYQIFLAQQRSFVVQEAMADAQQNARVAAAELTRSLASLGAGVDLPGRQMRLLVAHSYQIVFNADLSPDHGALPPGQPVPGALPSDPYATIPAGTFSANAPAETYRYTLDRNNDGRIDASDRTDGAHYTLYREVNGGQEQEVARLIANPRVEKALFHYWGDFDGDGNFETVDRVDATTSRRVAAGESLDAVVRRVEVELITETEHPDPRFASNNGYRQVVLKFSAAPPNLWDCPVVQAVSAPGAIRAPDARGTDLPVRFRVTRAGAPEAGRTVVFTLAGPTGNGAQVTDTSGTSDRAQTNAQGLVDAVIHWSAGCGEMKTGAYLVTAATAEPPTLSTPFGLCPSQTATLRIEVIPGTPAQVAFNPTGLTVPSCGGQGPVAYSILDLCGNPAAEADVVAGGYGFRIVPDNAFGTLSIRTLATAADTVTYEAPRVAMIRYPAVPRSLVDPNVFEANLVVPGLTGSALLRVQLQPWSLALNPTPRIPMTAFTDCPDPPDPVTDTFEVKDACDNNLFTLVGAGWVRASLGPPSPQPGTMASPNNRGTFSPDPFYLVNHGGTPGEFAIQYRAPTCSLGGLTARPAISLTPSWPSSPVTTLSPTVYPCTTCSVEVLDSTGSRTTNLDRVCDAQSSILVTQCVPTGTTAELVIQPNAGSQGLPSFNRASPQDRVTVTFLGGTRGQTARVPLFIGTAQSGDGFRVTAFIPNQATANALGGVTCPSDPISVDTSCSELLISSRPDNPQAVPSNPPAQDTPLCGAEGSIVYFRVKDCDQNVRAFASDDMKNLAGTNRGIIVEVLDATQTVLDTEGPDLFEVTVRGTRASDSPYFQGSLPVTRDPSDKSFSGLLRAPLDQVAIVRARYVDPNDPADRLCTAEALLIPPLPLCLQNPALTWLGWDGGLSVHWGDAAVGGDLRLPAAPALIEKTPSAPLSTSPYGPSVRDRFFNAYVGGTIFVGGTPLVPSGPVDQPFLAGGAGASFGSAFGNYFQSVPDMPALLSRLDYTSLKQLAQAWGVYWETEAGGTIFNPATLQRGTFESVTRLPAPGVASTTYDGRFLFVDAQSGMQSASDIDQASVGGLPTHEVTAGYYTEGFLYVAGSVVFRSQAGQQPVATEAASTADARYDENGGNFTRGDLPVDFDPSAGPQAVGILSVNLNGALYCDGLAALPSGFRVYGVVAAEKGIEAAASAEIWYDPRWRRTRPEACSQCCGLAIVPQAPRIPVGGSLRLATRSAQGAVVWKSLASQVASVGAQSGAVTGVAAGFVTIRAVDEGGCVAETQLEVF